MLSRRQFLQAALAAGAAAAVPPVFESFLLKAGADSTTAYFLTDPQQWATCAALCSRIVPTDTAPGATEAQAVVFIDRFLSAFELPSSAADNPPIWVAGRWSGRNPFPGPAGQPSSNYPSDEFLDASAGQGHFLPLTPQQEISWRVQLYGTQVAAGAAAADPKWAQQLGDLIPVSAGQRQLYQDGLAAFDSYSESLFGVPFSQANPEEQDLMLAAAGNVVLNAVTSNLPFTAPVGEAPPAASALFPVITLHTFQATYGIPEYAWINQANDPSYVTENGGTAVWKSIAYDGDSQPLGNSIFDAQMYGPGEGPNEGFGEAGVYVPFGGYREHRPVSTLDPLLGTPLTAAQGQTIKEAIVNFRRRK